MRAELIFIPALSHIMLVMGLYVMLGKAKSEAFRAGLVDPKVTALNPKAWPDNVVKISNSIGNQFETPVIFYLLTTLTFLTDSVSTTTLFLLSIYALSRYVHAYIHITSNYVPYRYRAFTLGIVLLLLITLWQFWQILTNVI